MCFKTTITTLSCFFVCVTRNCSSAEGIFTFYSNRAKDIINSLHAVTRNQSVVQPSAFQSGTPNSTGLGRGRSSGKKASSSNKMNPLLAFLRRNQSPSGGETAPGNQQGSKAKKSILAKSVSVMDHLSLSGKRGQLDESVDLGGFEDPRRGESLERTIGGGIGSGRLSGSSTSNSIHGDKKRSASESDLLNVNNKQGCVPDNKTAGDKCQKECEEGFYRSFDDIDDIDDLGVLASSNPLEAVVVLRSQLENEYALGEARCSFNSSDSGRMSDTYAETSNSSVTSSSNGSHSNRLFSNTSNCSGDSGAQLSIHSDYSTSGNSSSNNNNNNNNNSHNGFKENALGVLKEQESPNYPPFDNELYGKSISIATKTGNNHHHLLSGPSCSTLEKQTPSVGGGGSGTIGEYEDPTYSHIYEDNHHHQHGLSAQTGPPPLPPRFATVRKSFTLPHNMSGHTSNAKADECLQGQENNAKTKDLSKYFGLHDQGPGSPSKETAQMVALQNLPLSLSRLDEQKKRNLEKFFGIQNTLQNLEQHRLGQREGTIVVSNNGAELGVSGPKLPSFLTLPKTTSYQNGQHQDGSSLALNSPNGMSTNPRSRPNSLGFRMDHSSLEPALDNNNSITAPPARFRANNFRAFNKTLSRLTALEPGENSRSLPTTPDYPPELDSPRRKNLAKFLGLGNFTPSSPTTPGPMGLPLGSPARASSQERQGHQGLPPPPSNGILKKSALSNSTPMDLECGDDELTCTSSSSMRWQSNDGLATPGSLQGGCTPSFLTPMGSPRIFGPKHTLNSSCNQSICDVPSCGPKQSNSMFSIALATNPNSSSFHTGSLQRGPLQCPMQPDSTRGARSCSLQRGSTLQATQPPKLNRRQQKSMTRSATLDDLEWQRTQPVVWVNNSGCSFRRGRDIQMRRHSFQQQSQTHSSSIHNSSVILTRRSQSSAGDNKHGSAGLQRASYASPGGVTNLDLVVRPSSSLCHHQTPSSLENLTSCLERGPSPKVPKGILKREPVYLTMGGSRLMNAAPVLHLQTGSNKESEYLDMNRGGSSSRMTSMPRQRQNSVSFDQSIPLPGAQGTGGGLPSGSFQHTIQAIVHTSESPGQQKTIESTDQDIYDGITVVESQQISQK